MFQTIPFFPSTDDASDDFPIRPLIIAPSDALSDSGGAEPEVDDDEDEDEHPVYIPEDIHIPEGFELRESTVFGGLGVWTTSSALKGEKFGPFEGKLRDSVDNPTAAWEVSTLFENWIFETMIWYWGGKNR